MEKDTAGEQLAAAYLHQRGFDRFAERHRPVGGKKLDWTVDHPAQPFGFEVYEPEIHLPEGGGWFSSYEGLRGMFKNNKMKQIRAAKEAGLPFVGGLARTNAGIDFSPDIVAGAMFGDITTVMPIGPGGEGFDPTQAITTFGKDGKVQPKQMRGVSAVAIIRDFNPTLWRMEGELEVRTAKLPKWHAGMSDEESHEIQVEMTRMFGDIEEHFTSTGAYDPAARVTRFIVLHNPYADYPLRLDILSGPHDEQWMGFSEEGVPKYGERWRGHLIHEVPGRQPTDM